MEEETKFASPVRSGEKHLIDESSLVASQKVLSEIFGSLPGIAAILNKNRQVVFANDEFINGLGLSSLEAIIGKRPGEAISCLHATEEQGGCGTSEACSVCGAVNAIIESQKLNKKISRETHITTVISGMHKSWDLNITSAPIKISGEKFYVFSIEDISSEKRRESLERIFFHDILNIAGGLNGLILVLKAETDPEEVRDLIDMSEEASRNLIEEIMLHRQIRAAENGDLQVKIERLNSLDFLRNAADKMKYHELAKGRFIVIDKGSSDTEFSSDRILLQRVIINLLKNAIEATNEGGTVVAGCKSEGTGLIFQVHNEGIIPREIQLQLFQRSFSTKGKGRGIGTYSIRLLVENYLKGKVTFVSNEDCGTNFSVEIRKDF
jgi:K+-sensing histidine kinase KdpD